jgi:two-component system sensor histidine kinase MprB
VSLRLRMVLLTAAAVALAVVLSAFACYLAVDSSLHSRVDHQLKSFAGTIAAVAQRAPARDQKPGDLRSAARIPHPGLDTRGDVAIFDSRGVIRSTAQDRTAFHLQARDLAVIGSGHAYYRDGRVGSTQVRVYVRPIGHGRAVIAEQSLSAVESTVHQLGVILIAIGLLVARAAARPVHALRRAAEHVGSTGDLSRRIDTTGSDDLGRLGESFNAMLAALEESQRVQGQLVADASHELRTPIASLRTNLEVLLRNPRLVAADRGPLLRDVIEQSAELGELVNDLLESARDGDAAHEPERLDFEQLIASEIERCAARHPRSELVAELEPCIVLGHESRIRRAVANVLENAVKWSPPGTPIEVSLDDGVLAVRDQGEGFRVEDLPHVFDRFYRSPAARTVPGAGLGLSIVRKVAAEHGGETQAENAPGGGALVTLSLPSCAVVAPAAGDPVAPFARA